jgi:hypothetical protein
MPGCENPRSGAVKMCQVKVQQTFEMELLT